LGRKGYRKGVEKPVQTRVSRNVNDEGRSRGRRGKNRFAAGRAHSHEPVDVTVWGNEQLTGNAVVSGTLRRHKRRGGGGGGGNHRKREKNYVSGNWETTTRKRKSQSHCTIPKNVRTLNRNVNRKGHREVAAEKKWKALERGRSLALKKKQTEGKRKKRSSEYNGGD